MKGFVVGRFLILRTIGSPSIYADRRRFKGISRYLRIFRVLNYTRRIVSIRDLQNGIYIDMYIKMNTSQ